MEIKLHVFSNIKFLSSWANLNPLGSVLLYGEFGWTAFVEISALWSEGIFKGTVFYYFYQVLLELIKEWSGAFI